MNNLQPQRVNKRHQRKRIYRTAKRGSGVEERKCLMCLKMFVSESKGNRRCRYCEQKVSGNAHYFQKVVIKSKE